MLVLGVVFGLVAAEGLLQIGGILVRRWAVRGAVYAGSERQITILCVGDSHTYGMPLPEQDSYPAQLGRALASRHPDHHFRVVNLGIPGLNSRGVVDRLERQMFQLRPHVVIVWVGVNNLWNKPDAGPIEEEDRWQAVRNVLQYSKLFRLASIAWFSSTGHQYDPSKRGGWFTGEPHPPDRAPEGFDLPDPAPGLAADIERMTELSYRLDAPILFITYPPTYLKGVNRTILDTGRRIGVPVIETSRDVRRAAEDGYDLSDLVDVSMGSHPTALLYRYVVESILPEVETSLVAWHDMEFSGVVPAATRPVPEGD